LCLCQLVHTISSDVEVENASILDTDVTAAFTAETAPTKSAVCIHVNFQSSLTRSHSGVWIQHTGDH